MPAEQGIRGFRSLMNLPDRRAEDGPVGAARRYGANTVVEGLGVIVAMPQRDLDHDIEQCTALMHGVNAIAKILQDLSGHDLIAELARLRPLVEHAAAVVGESPPDLDHHDGAWTLAEVAALAVRWEDEIGGIDHEIGWLYVADLLLRLGSGERPD